MTMLALVLFFIHIVAIIAGGANAVIMPIVGAKMPTATPEVRGAMLDVSEKLANVGKFALATLIVTGLLILWLKWHWQVPNHWFWVKMLALLAMVVFIGFNQVNLKKLKGGDPTAAPPMKLFGQLTTVAFAIVLLAAVFTFQ